MSELIEIKIHRRNVHILIEALETKLYEENSLMEIAKQFSRDSFEHGSKIIVIKEVLEQLRNI